MTVDYVNITSAVSGIIDDVDKWKLTLRDLFRAEYTIGADGLVSKQSR